MPSTVVHLFAIDIRRLFVDLSNRIKYENLVGSIELAEELACMLQKERERERK